MCCSVRNARIYRVWHSECFLRTRQADGSETAPSEYNIPGYAHRSWAAMASWDVGLWSLANSLHMHVVIDNN